MSRTSARRIALVLLPLLFAFTLPQKTSAANPVKGEELFRGVLMGDGPVSQRLPELQKEYQVEIDKSLEALFPEDPVKQQEARTSIMQSRERVIVRINTARPGFFQRFRTEMTSGDPLRVEGALDEGVRLFSDAAMQELRDHLAEANLRLEDVQFSEGDPVVEGAAIAAVVAAVAAVAALYITAVHGINVLNIAQYVNLTVAYNQFLVYDEVRFWPAVKASPTSRLQKEMWVGLITERLAGVK